VRHCENEARLACVCYCTQAGDMQSLLLDLNDSASIQAAIDNLHHELHCFGIHVALVEPGPITSRFRKNCVPQIEKHIDWRNSLHRAQFDSQMARLNTSGVCRRSAGRILFHEFQQAG